MATTKISHGTVHKLPDDMRKALAADAKACLLWEGLTPLARNEWICWTISVKRAETHADHVVRVTRQLKEGKRRPCCWIGCIHRADKQVSPSVQGVLAKRRKSKK